VYDSALNGVFQVRRRKVESVNDPTLRISVQDRPLSERQRAILRFIQDYVQQHSHAPSIRDISQGVGIPSTSNVSYHINRLIQHGCLYKQPGTSRTLVILAAGYQPMDEPILPDWAAEMATLRAKNRRLREWCRQLERERVWEREQLQTAQAS
jgi:SOS-response transcriptional repressor LexA